MKGTFFGSHWVLVTSLLVGCSKSSSTQQQPPPYGYPPPPPGQSPYGQPGQAQPYPGYQQPGQGYPQQGQQPTYPAQGQPGQVPPQQPTPTTVPPQPQPPATSSTQGSQDPINRLDQTFLRSVSQNILNELVAALPAHQKGRVQGIPLIFDPEPGEVNAFAACTRQGQSLMAISDGLLEVTAFLAKSKANDELFATAKVNEYIQLLASQQRPGQPLVRPAAGFFRAEHQNDPRRLARQRAVFEEQVAFVLGHELAHHYLGHLPCTAGGAVGVGAAELNHALSSALPLLNQPNELASDVSGTQNVLTAGSRRTQGHRWTEAGGLLTMQFFGGLQHLTPVDLLFSFERSHPPAAIRTPVIQQTAAAWRATGGSSIALPF